MSKSTGVAHPGTTQQSIDDALKKVAHAEATVLRVKLCIRRADVVLERLRLAHLRHYSTVTRSR